MLRLSAFLVPGGSSLNAVQLNGLLALGNGPIEVALSQLSTVLVGYGVKRNQFGEVIPVARFLFQRSVYVGRAPIAIHVITGVESLPPTTARGVLSRRTTRCQKNRRYNDGRE